MCSRPSILDVCLHLAPGVRYLRSGTIPVNMPVIFSRPRGFPPRPPSLSGLCSSYNTVSPVEIPTLTLPAGIYCCSPSSPSPARVPLIFGAPKLVLARAARVSFRLVCMVWYGIVGIPMPVQVFHVQRLGRVATAGPVERASPQAWSASLSR